MEQVNTNEIPLPPSPPPKSCESHVDTTEQNLVSTPSEELLTEEIQEFQPTSASSSPSVALATSVSSCDSLTSTELDSHSQTRSLNELSNSPKPLGILLLHPTSTPLPRSVSTPSVSVSVTFAPLPTLDPRRRTSSVQLGVAARSQMLRARRTRVMGDTIEGVQHIPGEGISHVQYTAVQDHQQQQTQEQSTYQRPQRQRYQKRQSYVWQEDEDPERARGTSSRRPSVPKWGPTAGDSGDEMDEQDALLALGRMVRGGAKSLWRSFSQGSVKDRLRESTGGEGVENGPHSDETEIETEIVGRGRLSGRRNSSDPGRQSDLEQSPKAR
ncbi:hypothetical protein BC835DRAFT_356051 [Cytidiella melzeri]|nr:hypothetical protein BC835DRAFT_356051 [Cytidiella melzeri]